MTTWRIELLTIGLLLALPSLVLAQSGDVGDPNGPLSCPDRNSAGTPINQDYFAADQFSGTKWLIYLVERAHFNEQVLEDFENAYYAPVLGDLDYALEKIPNHPQVLMLMGATCRLVKDEALAAERFEKALALYPQYAITHAQYGHFLGTVGVYEQAIEKLQDAIRREPGLAVAHAWLAEVYFQASQAELGRASAEQARQLGFAKPIRTGPGTYY